MTVLKALVAALRQATVDVIDLTAPLVRGNTRHRAAA